MLGTVCAGWTMRRYDGPGCACEWQLMHRRRTITLCSFFYALFQKLPRVLEELDADEMRYHSHTTKLRDGIKRCICCRSCSQNRAFGTYVPGRSFGTYVLGTCMNEPRDIHTTVYGDVWHSLTKSLTLTDSHANTLSHSRPYLLTHSLMDTHSKWYRN